MKRFIYVTTRAEGYHQYETAPDEVSFLRTPHRHLFGVKVTIAVEHNERELEFIMVKHAVASHVDYFLSNEGINFSCETMAESIYNFIKITYGERDVNVEVNEDGENGAVLGDM